MAAVTLLALGNDAPDVAGEQRRGRDGEWHGDERDGPDDERGDERALAAGDGQRGGGDGGDQRVGRRSAGRGGRGEGPAVDSPRRRSAPLAARSSAAAGAPLRRPPALYALVAANTGSASSTTRRTGSSTCYAVSTQENTLRRTHTW
ncbi:Os01g0208200 [Oryza sativa Japonica Group]|uniref:Os01g0208200 protein n=1 Tax=Oryza sativa subsp. japonica TaxID=39947 RepID=A0A0P0UZN7_ORYSJ|nr:Os01g0208200 [Oryza sativa Japonica Group]